MRQAIIHIGTEKTGSTSIQSFLDVNRTSLVDQGVYILESPGDINQLGLAAYCIDDQPDQQQQALLNLLSIHDPEKHHKWKARFKEKVIKELKTLPEDCRVIFTTEHFHSRVKKPEEVNSLLSLLEPYFGEYRVLAYLRRQDLLATSLFNEAIKMGNSNYSIIPDRTTESSHFYNYFNFLKLWEGVFGRASIEAKFFETEKFYKNDLVEDFSSTCKIDTSSCIKLESSNESLSKEQQVLLVEFNRAIKSIAYKNNIQKDLRRFVVDELLAKPQGKGLTASPQQSERFLKIFEVSNNQLFDTYFNGQRFNSDYSHDYVRPEDIPINKDLLLSLIRKYFHKSVENIPVWKKIMLSVLGRPPQTRNTELVGTIIDITTYFDAKEANKYRRLL
jgi:hypothetical protein